MLIVRNNRLKVYEVRLKKVLICIHFTHRYKVLEYLDYKYLINIRLKIAEFLYLPLFSHSKMDYLRSDSNKQL